jgi:hypothetical protein
MIQRSNSLKELLTENNLRTAIHFTKEVTNQTRELFLSTRQKARLTGKMLAHFLASENNVTDFKSISLIGYSLGSQVLKSCINRLEKL